MKWVIYKMESILCAGESMIMVLEERNAELLFTDCLYYNKDSLHALNTRCIDTELLDI